MERSCFTACISLLSVVLLFPVPDAQASNESYYSSDLDDAVDAARRNPVNSTYVGARWYNRTTSRSFNLPPMLNTEMDEEVIEGAMGPTAAGEAAVAEAQQPARDAALGRQSKGATLDDSASDIRKRKNKEGDDDSAEPVEITQDIYIREARSANSTAREVRANNVTIRASSRP